MTLPMPDCGSIGRPAQQTPGDILGIETIGDMPIVYDTDRNGDEVASPSCDPVPGDTVGSETACSLNTTQSRRVNVAATLKRRR